jgi:transketolase
VKNGDEDLTELNAAIERAREAKDRPSLIIVRTTIGYGSPNKAGKSSAHGSPLGDTETAATKKALGWNFEESFHVPEEAREHFHGGAQQGRDARAQWEEHLARYRTEHPELARQWDQAQAGELPEDWDADIPEWDSGAKLATRAAGGKVLNALAARVPWLIGGDADLGGSTKTRLDGEASFAREAARNIHFGVREHAMTAIVNGMLYHGGVRAFCATFFVFSDYMRPAVRLAALSGLPAIYVWTHDSIGVGEDGPTHEPVEHLAALRAIPQLTILRPADANETAAAWHWALRQKEGPVGLVFSRQGLPVVADPETARSGVSRGGYVLRDSGDEDPAAILLATGSEVELAIAAQAALAKEGISTRVVSLPSWELFDAQDQTWRDQVLPPTVKARVAIEAGVSLGWHRWVGDGGAVVALDRFGASAPGDRVQEELGFTTQRVVETVRSVLV